jgi:hypothetical protein
MGNDHGGNHMSLSGNTFRLVWTNATSDQDYTAKTFEVIGLWDDIWDLWYALTYRSSLAIEPVIYSLNGRKIDPSKGINGLQGTSEYLPFKEKNPKT